MDIAANIMDLQPTLTLKPIRRLIFVLSWNFLRKHQKGDAIYASPPSVIPQTIGIGRYIGNQIKLEGQPAMGSPRCRDPFPGGQRPDPGGRHRCELSHDQSGVSLINAD
ncbi:hypothetical protein ABO04_06175 [Nitrosomonas sp. HPC101]|nr:hypothetical protein [Nitrosomonas sp. HPC101]